MPRRHLERMLAPCTQARAASQYYRAYPDQWRVDCNSIDQPLDVSGTFDKNIEIIKEISVLFNAQESFLHAFLDHVLLKEMSLSIFGSNNIERVCLGLEETMRTCMAVFRGDGGVEYTREWVHSCVYSVLVVATLLVVAALLFVAAILVVAALLIIAL